MRPLKLTLPGQFWDSQLYAGRLYLFGRSGDILTINWDTLIESFALPAPLTIAMECAFRRSDYLYGEVASGLVNDLEISNVLSAKFERLANQSLEVSRDHLMRHMAGQQDNRFPFPHADSEIYRRKLYVSGPSGISVAGCNKKTKHPISTRISRIWDAPALGISASYGSLAISAGESGLFERPIANSSPQAFKATDEPAQVSSSHCTDCAWAYYSIFGSSALGNGVLASYSRPEDARQFDRVIDDHEIFELPSDTTDQGYSWAAHDKICRLSDGRLNITRYSPWKSVEEGFLSGLGILSVDRPRDGNVVSAATALFGTIIEYDDGLEVLATDGSDVYLEGEPVSWRVFPRAKHYENHLHVIYDDRLEILSFNHDYLLDQEQKLTGTRFTTRGHVVKPLD